MITLADAKARLGITGAAQDAVITSLIDAAFLVAEAYCRRRFLLRTETETYKNFRGRALPLTRYPVVSVVSVTDNGSALGASDWDVIRGIGIIEFGHYINARTVTVQYQGGYDPTNFPADLALALWGIFDGLWAITPGAGVAAGSGAAVSGGMKSFSIPGVISVNYDASGSASSANTGAGAGAAIPPLAMSILNLYRREQA